MLSDELKLLVGLGNPGTEYEKTRHNVGFMVLEEIARKNNCSFRESKKLFGRTCEYGSGIEKTRLLMPNTYMNESGKSVRSAKDWFNFQNNQLIVLVARLCKWENLVNESRYGCCCCNKWEGYRCKTVPARVNLKINLLKDE